MFRHITSILAFLFVSVISSPSWSQSSLFACNPWAHADGSMSKDSFLLQFEDDKVMVGKTEYALVNSGGSSLIYIYDQGYPFVLFVHDGDMGFIPKELVHSNKTIFITEIESPVAGRFVPLSKQTKCKRS